MGKFTKFLSESKYIRMLESIHDKYLFKSVFFAGGPGSGKSYISKQMFSGLPIMFCDSDEIFIRLLKKTELPLKMRLSDPNIYMKQMRTRQIAKSLMLSKTLKWIDGMLPLVIDGTGKDYDNIAQRKDALNNVGYDTSMVFVNTSLDVALKRNAERERSVPEERVKEWWNKIHDNLGKFQDLFGSKNFHIVDNNTEISDEDMRAVQIKMTRLALKIISAPLENKTGIKIIEELNRTGGLYISDLEGHAEKIKEFKL